jgi:hypothetical protein
MGFSAMFAEEYILIDISLSAASWCDLSFQRQLKFIRLQHFYLSLVTGLTNHRISAQQKALTVLRNIMRITKCLALSLSTIFLVSCKNSSPAIKDLESYSLSTVDISSYQNKRLDSSSKYEILLPPDFKIDKLSKPGLIHYSLCPIDTVNKNYIVAGIQFGNHVRDVNPLFEIKLNKTTLVKGKLLDNDISWKICDYQNLICGETILLLNDSLKLHIYAYAKDYSQLDTLLTMLQTLKKH